MNDAMGEESLKLPTTWRKMGLSEDKRHRGGNGWRGEGGARCSKMWVD